jgi:hypothetical protein
LFRHREILQPPVQKKKNMEFLEVEERISPIDIVEEYNQYTQPASIADTYVVPDMVDGFLW